MTPPCPLAPTTIMSQDVDSSALRGSLFSKCWAIATPRLAAICETRFDSSPSTFRAPVSSKVYEVAISAGTTIGLHADSRITVSPECAKETAQSTAFALFGEPSTPTRIRRLPEMFVVMR